MANEVKQGDLLFRWVDPDLPRKLRGGKIHKQIGTQQQRATTTRKAGQTMTPGMDARLIRYTNVNIVHVGVCCDSNTVLEVGGAGVVRNALRGRGSNVDIVVRLNDAAGKKVANLANRIPRIDYKKIAGGIFTGYPLGRVGIRLLHNTPDPNAELVKKPAQAFSTAHDLDNYVGHHQRTEKDKLLTLFESGDKDIEKRLKEYGFQPVVCSHLVYAIIYKALRPAGSLLDALTNSAKFSVEPSRMWRDVCSGMGIWQEAGAGVIGAQHKGKINDEYTRLFIEKLETNLR